MRKLVVALLASLMGLALVTPASADWTPGSVAGTVLSSSGRPALGARVFVSDQWAYVQADGSFEIEINSGSYLLQVFQGTSGLDESDYPYEVQSFGQVTVEPNRTTRVDLTLPLKGNAPQELTAVAGTLSGPDGVAVLQRVYLIDEDGTDYSAFPDDKGRYIVAVPAGTYRLFAQSNSSRSTYMGQFYGDHPRGYALAWDEADVFVLSGPGTTDGNNDFVVPFGHYESGELGDSTLALPPATVDFEYGVYASYAADLQDFARIGRPEPDDSSASLEDYSVFMYPGLEDPNPGILTLYIDGSLFDPLRFEQLQVWRDFQPVPECDAGVTAPCVQDRSVDSDWDGDTIVIEVATEDGGVFTLGDRPQFYDSQDSVFAADILWLAGSGITKGCSEAGDVFCPDDPVTRGQMAAFLVRGLGLTDSLDNPFGDDDGSIFEPSIEKLAAAGITKGCNPPINDMFCPGDPVTRGQMAAFLARALGYTDAGDGDLFTDDDGSVFEGSIDKLATAGVTRGCNPPTNDRFCPSDVVTRGQMAAFLHRALG